MFSWWLKILDSLEWSLNPYNAKQNLLQTTFYIFIFYFSEKISQDISHELSAKQMIYMKCQLFSLKTKIKMSSAAIAIGTLRVMICLTLYIKHITKTHLYNFDPLKPHFYIVKLGFTGVNTIFLILLKIMHCGYSLELPHWAEIWKISVFFYLKIFSFWIWNFLYIWIVVFS